MSVEEEIKAIIPGLNLHETFDLIVALSITYATEFIADMNGP